MQDTIKNLYYGNICPIEQLTPQDPDYKDTEKYIQDHEDKLLSILGTEEVEIFEKFLENNNSLRGMETVQAFIDGYKLGSLIMMEILDKSL